MDSSKANEAVEQGLSQAKALLLNMRTTLIDTYWQIGGIAHKLQAGYGDATIKDFAKRLGTTSGCDISDSTVYRARAFFSKTSEEEKKRLIAAGISWSQIVATLPASKEVINEAVAKVERDEVAPEKFADVVKQSREAEEAPAKASESEDSEDGVMTEKQFDRSAAKIMGALQKAIDSTGDIIILCEGYGNLPPGLQKAKRKDVEDLLESLKSFSSCGGAAVRAIESALNSA